MDGKVLTSDLNIKPVPLEAYTPPSSAEALVQTAKLLEKAGRGAEMLVCAVSLIKMCQLVALSEVELICAAFKLTIEQHRTSLRLMRVQGKIDETYVKEVVKSCENDIRGICEDALELLPPVLDRLLEGDAGARVLIHTMIGDYNRYLCEIEPDEQCRVRAEEAYGTAANLAENFLPAAHALRLGVALNRSILAYEITKSPDQGVAIAKQAFDESTIMIDALAPYERSHALEVLDRLRENVSMWTENEDIVDDEHLELAAPS